MMRRGRGRGEMGDKGLMGCGRGGLSVINRMLIVFGGGGGKSGGGLGGDGTGGSYGGGIGGVRFGLELPLWKMKEYGEERVDLIWKPICL